MTYSEKQTTQIIDQYKLAEDKKAAVAKIAENLGKSTRSVIAKLAREGVYQREHNVRGPTKAEYITIISNKLAIPEELLDSLEKSTKPTLRLIAERLEFMAFI